jgi:hypothetical protein
LNDYLFTFELFWSESQLVGFSGISLSGTETKLGNTIASKNIKSYVNVFTQGEFHFLGFFGTSSDEKIFSLGGIRMKTDCKNFAV